MFSRLLREPPPSAERIAEEVSGVLRRNEEARIYAWYQRTKEFPPRRDKPARGTGPPKRKRLQ